MIHCVAEQIHCMMSSKETFYNDLKDLQALFFVYFLSQCPNGSKLKFFFTKMCDTSKLC